jgi:hypothetical protein
MRAKPRKTAKPNDLVAVKEFQEFCDRIANRAEARGLTNEKLDKLLNPAES